jgi:hypothetical protein
MQLNYRKVEPSVMGSVETHLGSVGMRKQPQNCGQNVVFNALAIQKLSRYCLRHRSRNVSCSAAGLSKVSMTRIEST